MNSDSTSSFWLFSAAGMVIVVIFVVGLVPALCITIGIVIAWPVVGAICRSTARGDFPGFVEDVFPEETKQVRDRRKK